MGQFCAAHSRCGWFVLDGRAGVQRHGDCWLNQFTGLAEFSTMQSINGQDFVSKVKPKTYIFFQADRASRIVIQFLWRRPFRLNSIQPLDPSLADLRRITSIALGEERLDG